ncbi:syntaxin-22-like [Syzygium oleosum]|uniref:syntaxin-22-like n=1 Tax=Syzygium oleosum TaxID=219896 RepID=UPI0024BA2F32|nr:syntaxin-22-like [Syzygium oleosum]
MKTISLSRLSISTHLGSPPSPSLEDLITLVRYKYNRSRQRQIETRRLTYKRIAYAWDFQTTLLEFQKVQQLVTERESAYAPSVPPPSATTFGSDEQVASRMAQEFQPFLMDQWRQEFVLLENEREQGVREVEEQRGQANEIFRDLAALAREQGVVIDDIQSNIENSAAATKQTKVRLVKASKSTKSRSSWVSIELDYQIMFFLHLPLTISIARLM